MTQVLVTDDSENKEKQYIRTIALTLKRIKEQSGCTEKDRNYLQNILQGFLLNYFYIQLRNQLLEKEGVLPDNRFMVVLSNILSENIFPRVRETFIAGGDQVVNLCDEICVFSDKDSSSHFVCTNKLYGSIFARLCPNVPPKKLNEEIINKPEIRRMVLKMKFEKAVEAPELRNMFDYMVATSDQELILPFLAKYIHAGKFKRLVDIMKSGDWRYELSFLAKRADSARAA